MGSVTSDTLAGTTNRGLLYSPQQHWIVPYHMIVPYQNAVWFFKKKPEKECERKCFCIFVSAFFVFLNAPLMQTFLWYTINKYLSLKA